ncbi:MAG: Gfo/Idh/MocA family oxidoreductase [bacterium]
MNKIKAGVVGIGRMGEYHTRIYAELLDVELKAIVDIYPEKAKNFEKMYQTEHYINYQDIFGKVDLVSISVPTSLHYKITKDFLNQGIHVLLEKPITTNYEEAKELFSLAKEKSLVLHIGHVERFNGAVQELEKIVENPILIESRRLGPYARKEYDTGVVLDLLIHDIDIILNLVKSPIKKISAIDVKNNNSFEDAISVQILFENNCIANLIASRITEEKVRTLSITQKNAYIILDYTEQNLQIHRSARQEYFIQKEEILYKQESIIEKIFVHKDNPLKLEIINFIKAATSKPALINNDQTELQSLKIALNILEIINEIS